MREDRRADECGRAQPCMPEASQPDEPGDSRQHRPGDAGEQAVRVGEDKRWLMAAGEVGREGDRLPAHEDEGPQHEVEE